MRGGLTNKKIQVTIFQVRYVPKAKLGYLVERNVQKPATISICLAQKHCARKAASVLRAKFFTMEVVLILNNVLAIAVEEVIKMAKLTSRTAIHGT